MEQMLLGRKFSPIVCQRALDVIVSPLIHQGYFLFHFLDDFLILGPDPAILRLVTGRVVRALCEASFVVLHKSTLEPT